MKLNQAIKDFKLGNQLAFSSIISYMNNDINYIIRNFKIPGKDFDDLRSLAMEQILDCLVVRQLKRGQGIKKVLNECDDELKNRNFIKAAIKNKLIRESRATKSRIRVSYDIPILDERGNNYLDRKGKPIFIGLIFKEDGAYLYEGCRNTRLKINANKEDICRNNCTYDMKDPIDASISFDMKIDDKENEHEIKDVIEYNTCRNKYNESEKQKEVSLLIDYVNKIGNINENIRNTIKDLLLYSNNTCALKDYVKNNRKQVNQCKYTLLQLITN